MGPQPLGVLHAHIESIDIILSRSVWVSLVLIIATAVGLRSLVAAEPTAR